MIPSSSNMCVYCCTCFTYLNYLTGSPRLCGPGPLLLPLPSPPIPLTAVCVCVFILLHMHTYVYETLVTTYPSDNGVCVCVCVCVCAYFIMGYSLYSKYLTWYFTRIVYIRPLTELLY